MSVIEAAVAELERYVKQKTLEFARSQPGECRLALNQNRMTPDFRAVIGDDCIADSIKAAIREVKSPASARSYFEKFDEMAQDYGRSEYDEDTGYVRSGYKKECYVCTEVRNILAKAIGEKALPLRAYYSEAEYKDDRGDR